MRERAVERYAAQDASAALGRLDDWRARSADPQRQTLRQRRHRLTETVRPRGPARSSDPYEIAAEALKALSLLPRGSTNEASARYSLVGEAIRRLAWGPED